MWFEGFISELEKLAKPLLGVDFDGTIVESDPKQGYKITGIKKGAIKNLTKLQKKYDIGIFSARNNIRFSDAKMKEMRKYILKNKIPCDKIIEREEGKPLYQVLIDDRARQFKNNWDELGKL